MSKRLGLWLVLSLSLLVLMSGCTSTIPLKYTPIAAVQTAPESMQKERILVTHFVDARKKPELAHVGSRTVVTEDDIGQFVAEAVVDALRKAGIRADLNTSIDPASVDEQTIPSGYNAVFVGKILNFDSTIKPEWSNVVCKGTVTIEYRWVSRRGQDNSVWHGPVTGKSVTEVPVVMWSDISNFTDAALQKCMQQLITDIGSR